MGNQEKLVMCNLYKSRDEGKPETIVLECQNGRVFAHKTILIAGSDYFEAMFSRANIENEANVVSLLDTNVEIINIIVKFIYAQDIPTLAELPEGLINEIIIAADRMQLKGLFDKYWQVYSTSLTIETFLNVWRLAEMFQLSETSEIVKKFIFDNLKRISAIPIIFDLTFLELEKIIADNEPVEIGEFIEFLLIWGSTNRTDDVIDLILKCDLKKLPNYVLRDLLSANQVAINSKPIYDLLSKEATSRWLTATSSRIAIHTFEAQTKPGRCFYSVKYLTCDDRRTEKKQIGMVNLFPAVSRTGNIFYFRLTKYGFVALDTRGRQYEHFERFLTEIDLIRSETTNRNEIFFRRTIKSYASFNFEEKTWRTVKFDEIDECDSMLLATVDEKYIFDVDERRMKVVDKKLGTCRTAEKFPGIWTKLQSKTIDTTKIIFFRNSPIDNLIIYDAGQEDFWSSVVSVTVPGIINPIGYVSYVEDTLLFDQTAVSCDVYSLKTNSKVHEHVPLNNFRDTIYFDVSVNNNFSFL